jgi:hypothetical protein
VLSRLFTVDGRRRSVWPRISAEKTGDSAPSTRAKPTRGARHLAVAVRAAKVRRYQHDEQGDAMAEITGRDLHLVKKALAIAVLAIE